jgi:hypothetical protein
MTQADLKTSIQEIRDRVATDGATLTLCAFGGAMLCIPFFGFLPLLAVCFGLLSVLATHRLISSKIKEMENKTDASDNN